MLINGKWFDKGSSAHIEATLEFEGNHFYLQTQASVSKQGTIDELNPSDRLGNVERKITFNDGSVFATSDNDTVDLCFKSVLKTNRFIHSIESSLPFVAIAIVLITVISFSFFKWGVPAISSTVANALPQKTNDIIGSETLVFLDKYIFEESQLDQNTQDKIRQHFQNTLAPIESTNEQLTFTLHFREWKSDDFSIPNALALPSGDIIVTDKFVELSHNQDEIDSVLLHEMGHIVHRHSLKMIIQSTLVTTIVTMATGDANGVADLGFGLGSLLLSTNYSRSFESEADQYAFDLMLQHDIDPISFANIMRRITSYSDNINSDDTQEYDEPATPETQEEKHSNVTDYFSTHPATEKRAHQAEMYSQCYAKRLKVCDTSINVE